MFNHIPHNTRELGAEYVLLKPVWFLLESKMSQKQKVLEELLGELEVSYFSISWIERSKADEDTIRQNYEFLREIGLSNKEIASQAHLVSMGPETIQKHYQALQELGLSDEKIAAQAQLLAMNPETIQRNYQTLKELGLSDKKIAGFAHLLGRKPETIRRNHQRLQEFGLSKEKIASQAALLARNPKSIQRNYQHHVGLLRQDYQDRNSGKGLLINQANLLGIPPETMEANVQYLHSIYIDYNDGPLLGTRSQTKRKKLAWMLRELFDYRKAHEEDKRGLIERLYDFVRDNPRLLANSINSLERNKEKLRKKV